MRALSTSATVCVMCEGSRRSAIRAASVSETLRRRSASASNITPLSEDNRPPSNAAVTFLRETDGRLKLSWLSSDMAGVGSEAGARRVGLQHPFPMRVQRFAPYPLAQNASRLNKMG